MHPFCISIIHLTILPRIFAWFFRLTQRCIVPHSPIGPAILYVHVPHVTMSGCHDPTSESWISYLSVPWRTGGGEGKHWCWVKVRSRINCIILSLSGVVTSCCILLQYMKLCYVILYQIKWCILPVFITLYVSILYWMMILTVGIRLIKGPVIKNVWFQPVLTNWYSSQIM